MAGHDLLSKIVPKRQAEDPFFPVQRDFAGIGVVACDIVGMGSAVGLF